MSSIFSIALGELDQSGEMTPKTWQQVREAMRRMLVSELRRRSLWDCSPRYLGIFGHWRWSDGKAGDAIDELTDTMLIHIFVDRLAHLIPCLELEKRHANVANEPENEQRSAVKSLIWRFVRQRIYEIHRREDRPGYGVYLVLAAAIELLLDRDELFWREPPPDPKQTRRRIGARTTFSFFEELELRLADDAFVAAVVMTWENGLRLADWLAWEGEQKQTLIEATARDIAQLKDGGVQAFCFRQLLDPLRDHIRALVGRVEPFGVARDRTWAQLMIENDALVWTWRIDPDPGPELRAHFEAIARCVEQRIMALPGRRARDQDYLLRLWRHLQAWQLARAGLDLADDGASKILQSRLSYRELAKTLDLPRDRIRPLLSRLKENVADCEQILAGLESPDTLSGSSSPPPEKMMSRDAREQIAARFRALRTEQAVWADRAPGQVGDVLRLGIGGEHGIVWLWHGASSSVDGSARARLVPVDSYEPYWPDDIELGSVPGLGPSTLRLGFFADIDIELAARGRLLVHLPAGDWQHPDERAESGITAAGVGTARSVDDELDPDLVEWAEILERTCGELAAERRSTMPFQRTAADSVESGAEETHRGGDLRGQKWRVWATAASILLALTLGVFFWREWTHDERDQELRRELTSARDRVAELEIERERWQLQRAEHDHQIEEIRRESAKRLAEREISLTAQIEQLGSQLQKFLVPQLAVPWKKLDLTRARGLDDDPIYVPDSAHAIHLLLSDVRQGDTIEIWTGGLDDRGALSSESTRVWRGRLNRPQKVETRDGTGTLEVQYEQLIRIPTSLLPAGHYVVRHQPSEGEADDYPLTVVRGTGS